MKKHVWIWMIILALAVSACGSPATPTATAPAQPVTNTPYPAPESGGALPGVVIPGNWTYPMPGEATLFDVQEKDADLERREVEVNFAESSIEVLGSTPRQAALRLQVVTGDLCEAVRVKVSPPQSGRIDVEVYAIYDSTLFCGQATDLITVKYSLGALSAGSYQVYINGEMLGSFDS